jgi:DNA-binding NtrC family response regulator
MPVSSTTIDAAGNDGIRIRIPDEGVPFTEVEKGLLEESLKMTRWNVRRAAQLLHMSYDTFRYRMQKYELG